MFKVFVAIGAINALLAVLLGAFATHGLEGSLSADMLETFETGARYHFYHALGLIAIGIISTYMPESTLLNISGWLMLAGIVIFSGSLYLLSTTGISWLGAITPIGGLSFIAAWILLIIAVLT